VAPNEITLFDVGFTWHDTAFTMARLEFAYDFWKSEDIVTSPDHFTYTFLGDVQFINSTQVIVGNDGLANWSGDSNENGEIYLTFLTGNKSIYVSAESWPWFWDYSQSDWLKFEGSFLN